MSESLFVAFSTIYLVGVRKMYLPLFKWQIRVFNSKRDAALSAVHLTLLVGGGNANNPPATVIIWR